MTLQTQHPEKEKSYHLWKILRCKGGSQTSSLSCIRMSNICFGQCSPKRSRSTQVETTSKAGGIHWSFAKSCAVSGFDPKSMYRPCVTPIPCQIRRFSLNSERQIDRLRCSGPGVEVPQWLRGEKRPNKT